jgi:hypothetical protein
MSSSFRWLTLHDWNPFLSFSFLSFFSVLSFFFLYIFLSFIFLFFIFLSFLFFLLGCLSYILLSLKDSKVKYKIFVGHIFCEDLLPVLSVRRYCIPPHNRRLLSHTALFVCNSCRNCRKYATILFKCVLKLFWRELAFSPVNYTRLHLPRRKMA